MRASYTLETLLTDLIHSFFADNLKIEILFYEKTEREGVALILERRRSLLRRLKRGEREEGFETIEVGEEKTLTFGWSSPALLFPFLRSLMRQNDFFLYHMRFNWGSKGVLDVEILQETYYGLLEFIEDLDSVRRSLISLKERLYLVEVYQEGEQRLRKVKHRWLFRYSLIEGLSVYLFDKWEIKAKGCWMRRENNKLLIGEEKRGEVEFVFNFAPSLMVVWLIKKQGKRLVLIDAENLEKEKKEIRVIEDEGLSKCVEELVFNSVKWRKLWVS